MISLISFVSELLIDRMISLFCFVTEFLIYRIAFIEIYLKTRTYSTL
jgi:hypothetical protein